MSANEDGGAAVAPAKKDLLTPEARAIVEANKARNAIVTAIRGTLWGKDLNQLQQRAVAEYCRQNGLDAVRHVEVLGGRIYLLAELYRERGAPLIRDGIVQLLEPDHINADQRLDEMAKAGDEWAAKERERRIRERIRWNVPEGAKAVVVQRARVTSTGNIVVGVNWVGGSNKKDPVGEAEPAKTAESRAERRMWRKIADVIPEYGRAVKPIEDGVRTALPVTGVEPEEQPRETRLKNIDDPYQLGAGDRPAENVERRESEAAPTDAELLAEDREIAASER